MINAGDAASTGTGLSITMPDITTGTAKGLSVVMTKATTHAKGISVTMPAITAGDMLYLDASGSTLDGGFYINCNDDNASDFTVGNHGATVITGTAAGTAALTLTAGDLVITDTDASTISSANGTGTLLTLDNVGGVIADNTAVLSIDAGGAVASGGNLLRIAPTGSPNAGAIGIEYVGSTKAMTAMFIDGDPTASDLVTINGGGALTDDNAVLVVSSDGALATGGNTFRVETTGTPASGAIYTEFDFAGVTSTNENIGVKIDAGGKKVIGLHVDADPEANSAVYFTSGAILAADKATLELVSNVAACNADSSVVRVTQDATDGVAFCMTLKQDDVSEPFINFESAAGAGGSIDETATTEGTATGFLRIGINGTDRYLTYYTAPTGP